MHVPLDAVKIPEDRQPVPDDETFAALVASMAATKKLEHPILVNGNMSLIDGLARLQAARQLGWKNIDAKQADLYEEALENLENAHGPSELPRRPLRARRIYEIQRDLYDLMKDRMRRLRKLTAAEKREYYAKAKYVQNPLPSVLRIGAGTLNGSKVVYETALTDTGPTGDFARNLVSRLEDGQMSASTAIHNLNDFIRNLGTVIDVRTQRERLDRIVVHLKGVQSAGQSLGLLSSELSAEEIDGWLSELYGANTALYRLRASLRKERSNK